MSNVSPLLIAVIVLMLALTLAYWVVRVRIMWVFLKMGVLFGSVAVAAVAVFWVWHTLQPA